MPQALAILDTRRRAFTRAAGVAARHNPASAIRVLHLFKHFRPDFTGDGLYLEKLIPLLDRFGIRNDVAAEQTRAVPGQAHVRLFGRGSTRLGNPLMLLWFLLTAWRYHVVHLHSAVDRYFAYHLIGRLFGCRVVQSCTLDDGMDALVNSYRPGFRPIARHLCRLITDVVAISPALYTDTRQITPAGRVHLIPQGVILPALDRTGRDAARALYGLGPADTVALFIGGLCPCKDARFLVDHHPDLAHLHLMLVGPELDHAYVAALRAAIAASPATARIHLAGYMNDPTTAYRAADLFVFASHKEGCPNVLLEAMAHGLPVISRDLPGTTDFMVDHARTGLLFETGVQYKAALTRLATDPTTRAAMSRAARNSIAQTFSLHGVATRYARLYRKTG